MLKSLLLALFVLVCSSAWASVEFDNVDDELTCGSDSSIDDLPLADFSYSAWIYPESAGEGGAGRLISKRTLSSGVGGWTIFTADTNAIRMITVDGGGVEADSDSADSSISWNAWHHVAMNYDQSTKTIDLYVDGTEVSYATQTAGTFDPDSDASGNMLMGNTLFVTDTRTFDGQINDVAIWTVLLTQEEITQLASSRVKGMPLQISPSNLVAYWPMDDQPDGTSDSTYRDVVGVSSTCTGTSGTTAKAEEVLSYIW